MCVVAIVEEARPSAEQVRKMYDANAHGGGVAWRENGLVHWSKGLDLEEMQEFNRSLPLPYILHFRIPSHNTSSSIFACHPFPVAGDVDTRLRGQMNGFVLFHNGHWNDWRKKLEDFSCRGGWKIPSGPWSDTRALAWTAHHMGFGMLELIDEKVVVFGPNEDDLEIFGTWTRCETDTDKSKHMLVTNRGWESRFTVDDRLPTAYRNQNSTPIIPGATQGGSPHIGSFRSRAAEATRLPIIGSTQQDTVQKEDAKVVGGAEQAARAQEASEVRRPFGLVGDVTIPDSDGILSSKCMSCGNSKGGVEEDGIRLCWQCWSNYQKVVENGAKLCEFCFKSEAQHFLTAGPDKDKKICGVCWHKRGSPSIRALDGMAGVVAKVESGPHHVM